MTEKRAATVTPLDRTRTTTAPRTERWGAGARGDEPVEHFSRDGRWHYTFGHDFRWHVTDTTTGQQRPSWAGSLINARRCTARYVDTPTAPAAVILGMVRGGSA